MVGPNYQRPDTSEQLPANFKAADGWKIATPADDAAKGDWWKSFRDPKLNSLVGQAMEKNQTLKAAFSALSRHAASRMRGAVLCFLMFPLSPLPIASASLQIPDAISSGTMVKR